MHTHAAGARVIRNRGHDHIIALGKLHSYSPENEAKYTARYMAAFRLMHQRGGGDSYLGRLNSSRCGRRVLMQDAGCGLTCVVDPTRAMAPCRRCPTICLQRLRAAGSPVTRVSNGCAIARDGPPSPAGLAAIRVTVRHIYSPWSDQARTEGHGESPCQDSIRLPLWHTLAEPSCLRRPGNRPAPE